MLLAQITDTHVTAERRGSSGTFDPAACLAASVKHLNALEPRPDAVIITGDLTEEGTPDEYAAFRDVLNALTLPWYAIPGNHDERTSFLTAFSDQAYLAGCDDFVHYSIEDYTLRLVALDTTVPGKPHGWLCEARLGWLDETLSREPSRPTLLFQHHPPFETGIDYMDAMNLRNGAEQLELLAKHPQVKHVACGHVHRPCETAIGGVGLSIAPNAAHAISLALGHKQALNYAMEPPAVRLFWASKDGAVTSHLSFVGSFEGPQGS